MRYKKILVGGDFLVNLCIENEVIHAKCIRGLPDGAKFCYSIPSTYRGVWIVVEHKSFPMLKEGDVIPELLIHRLTYFRRL